MILLFILVFQFFEAFYQDPKPPISINLSELTVSQIHSAYKKGEYTSENLVQAYLDRITKLNDTINALTAINPEALAIARQLDEEFAKTGKLRPLHGIPIIVKDNINTKGLPTTAGALALVDFVPKEDAFIIQKLVAAGAIILAKSNMAEWAFTPWHSESSTAGTTRNPYNLDFVPAGSSGGTGAAIAANMGTIGLGTDTGNSIRGPSSHNSLVGFRTTLGLVSRSAIVPLYLRNDVVGPMSRTVEDAVRVLEITAGYDPADPLTKFSEGKIPDNYSQFLVKDGLRGARIGVLRILSEKEADPEISRLFNQALVDMEGLGAMLVDSVKVVDFDTLSQGQRCPTFRQDLEAFFATYVKRDTLMTINDVIRIGTKYDYVRDRLESERDIEVPGNMVEECGNAYTDLKRIAFREAIEKVMDSLGLDALVYPTWNNRPARIVDFRAEYKGDNSRIIAPHTGQPAFTVPMGFSLGNLPAGIQFLGRMYSEPTLIRLSYSYEQGTKHRKAPDLK